MGGESDNESDDTDSDAGNGLAIKKDVSEDRKLLLQLCSYFAPNGHRGVDKNGNAREANAENEGLRLSEQRQRKMNAEFNK